MLKSAASRIFIKFALLELDPWLLQANHSTNSSLVHVKKLTPRKSRLIALISPPGAEMESSACGTT